MKIITDNDLFCEAVEIRRHLHEYPELEFELYETVKYVKSKLKSYGIDYTEKYGKSSVVAEIGQGNKLIAIRADMDALPVEEANDVPYRSKNTGCMHACGHDAHTAVLLAVAKYLKKHESELNCRVRLIFQPSEESGNSGAKMMVDAGVTDGVSKIFAAHCDNSVPVGSVGVCAGEYMAACVPFTLKFIGKSAHATVPHDGVDAIAMSVKAYSLLKEMMEREANGKMYIWSVGKFSGGTVHNIIADQCEMAISFRYYDPRLERIAEKMTRKICDDIAKEFGGSYELDWHISTCSVNNDIATVTEFKSLLVSQGIPVYDISPILTSEDFGWYLSKIPGMLFRFGTGNEALGCTQSLHKADFKIDEKGMKTAIDAFCSYALNIK